MNERKGIKITTSGEMLANELKRELEKHLNVSVRYETTYSSVLMKIYLLNSCFTLNYEINRFDVYSCSSVYSHYEKIKTNLINYVIYK